jgi:hypothetical protein
MPEHSARIESELRRKILFEKTIGRTERTRMGFTSLLPCFASKGNVAHPSSFRAAALADGIRAFVPETSANGTIQSIKMKCPIVQSDDLD